MYTEPKIVTSNDLDYRSYVEFIFNGKRFREYNGNKLSIKLFPNRAKSLKEKNRLLSNLLFEYQRALIENRFGEELSKQQAIIENQKPQRKVDDYFNEILQDKLNSPLSEGYKRELEIITKQFINFLAANEFDGGISDLTTLTIESFLNKFNTSGSHYMNKRRTLGVFFSEFVRKKYLTENPIKSTLRKKVKAKLHQVYEKQQVKQILSHLQEIHPNLFLCCVLSYSCLLRPHQEIRFLKRKHFDKDVTTISLSGMENKSGRVRVVGIPEYVRVILKERLSKITDPEINIFSLEPEAFGEYYFSTSWKRCTAELVEKKILQPNQTIYSFRHTAAVDIYKRTKDIHILQQLLGHSTMIVTLKYLRGLGELNSQELKEVLPTIEL